MNDNHQVSDLRALVQILSEAYGNSLDHEGPRTIVEASGLDASDKALQNAAIRLSSLVLNEIAQGPCSLNEEESAEPNLKCALDDGSVRLRDLTDLLSHAAQRLERGRASMSLARNAADEHAATEARMSLLEHLYRLVFTLSMAHFDLSQRGAYLKAARVETITARKFMEIDCIARACDSGVYATSLSELSRIEGGLDAIPASDAVH